MKNRRPIRIQSGAANATAAVGPFPAAPAQGTNSSAILGATLLVDLDDVSAVLRTAILLARSLKSSVSLDILGKHAVHIAAGDEVSHTSLPGLLDSVESQLRKYVLGKSPAFVLEASITAASFLSAGVIAVRIRPTDFPPQRPILAQ